MIFRITQFHIIFVALQCHFYFSTKQAIRMKLRKGLLETFVKSLTLGVLLIVNILLLQFILSETPFQFNKKESSIISENSDCFSNSYSSFGFDHQNFQISSMSLKSNQLLPDLFSSYGFDTKQVRTILENLKEHLDFRSLKAGTKLAFVSTNDCTTPDFFAFELSPKQVLVADLGNDGCCKVMEKQSEIKSEIALGMISSSLWEALEDQSVPSGIIDQMEDALSSSLDFHQVQAGNVFKLLYDRLYIDGKPTAEGKLKAAYFKTDQNEHYAYGFLQDGKFDYYDNEGRPMRKFFLKAPVRFSRISSPFTSRRFHPVLKFNRPHLGTDYAAPYGTPIIAVGNGVVEAAAYTGGNGKFVKIRHDKTYQTQYLHMSKFAQGIRAGTHVQQGQVIGYVGSTGLATGPHVCFRFWKNGAQVDHRKLNFPAQEPLPTTALVNFSKYRDSLKTQFLNLEFATAKIRS